MLRFDVIGSYNANAQRRTALDSPTIRQSYKHPTLCTISVDGYQNPAAISPPTKYPEHHWRLPNTDPRNEGKYLFRLHTLDVYFWTAEDAHSFVRAVRRIFQPQQLEILYVPSTPAAHEQVMSPVVQQLENVAIQDPAYHNGQTRNSRASLTSPSSLSSLSGHPDGTRDIAPKAEDPTAFKPLAYNPAAPPAPEPIKHREKTPPPLEAEAGTGLAAAAYHDQAQAMSSSSPATSQPQFSQGYVGAHHDPTRTSTYASPSPSNRYSGSSPSMQGHRLSSVSSLPGPPTQGRGNSASPYPKSQSFGPPPANPLDPQKAHSQQLTTTFSPPPQDPNARFYTGVQKPLDSPATQILGDSYVSGPPQPLQHLQPQYADYLASHSPPQQSVGGYSDYKYEQSQRHHGHHGHHSHGDDYDIHNQVYRPTEEEAHKVKHHKPPEVKKIDKGVNRFLKKLEKKVG